MPTAVVTKFDGIWLARQIIDCILISLNRFTQSQIFFRNSAFCSNDIHMLFYWLIVCLQVNWMCATSSWFRSKLVKTVK